ncbi:YicC/YloC family endoribonuclease [Acidocella sp. KAb 2-4]|uniref:YicC/YloC family endoribonuclease n=1 Tax=Acidocella sp. KAb 2-4 TaxID=2885158 RepID=UPI001D07562E|nr:YicC/YloC family endoribonuclease [Acidocella sp. KAb 2-4]MCB5943430.1 YicC family protein [Acidocella sp. KAb 2-4]
MTEISKIASMTGFARAQGELAGTAWVWELRSVNGRGLDVKLRLPAGLEALEFPLRELAAKRLKRGNVAGTLSLKREQAAAIMPDMAALERIKTLAIELADDIPGALPPRAELLLALPGVMRSAAAQEESEEERAALQDAVRAGFVAALDGLAEARAAEGRKLAEIVLANLREIAALHEAAGLEAAKQPELHRARLAAQLAEIIGGTPNLPEERIAQEIALLATKSDVREELDRLSAHIEAARALLREGAGVGRKLDFLMQEFNREANTLCSKSASVPLTNIGLALKAAIEQLREQVQNIE